MYLTSNKSFYMIWDLFGENLFVFRKRHAVYTCLKGTIRLWFMNRFSKCSTHSKIQTRSRPVQNPFKTRSIHLKLFKNENPFKDFDPFKTRSIHFLNGSDPVQKSRWTAVQAFAHLWSKSLIGFSFLKSLKWIERVLNGSWTGPNLWTGATFWKPVHKPKSFRTF